MTNKENLEKYLAEQIKQGLVDIKLTTAESFRAIDEESRCKILLDTLVFAETAKPMSAYELALMDGVISESVTEEEYNKIYGKQL
jgi:hypothetical protein